MTGLGRRLQRLEAAANGDRRPEFWLDDGSGELVNGQGERLPAGTLRGPVVTLTIGDDDGHGDG